MGDVDDEVVILVELYGFYLEFVVFEGCYFFFVWVELDVDVYV